MTFPAVLMWRQARYTDEEVRTKIFNSLNNRVRPEMDHNRGRSGADLWRICFRE